MSKKNKAPMSLMKNYTLKYTIYGLAWLAIGVVLQLPKSKMTTLLTIMLLIFEACVSVVAMAAKTETVDEMAELHLMRAKANTLEVFILALAVLVLIVVVRGIEANLGKIYPFVLGTNRLLTGVLFWYEERIGD